MLKKIKKIFETIIRFFTTIPTVVKTCPKAFVVGVVIFIFATILLGMIFSWNWFSGFLTGITFVAVILFEYSVYLHENNN